MKLTAWCVNSVSGRRSVAWSRTCALTRWTPCDVWRWRSLICRLQERTSTPPKSRTANYSNRYATVFEDFLILKIRNYLSTWNSNDSHWQIKKNFYPDNIYYTKLRRNIVLAEFVSIWYLIDTQVVVAQQVIVIYIWWSLGWI